MGDKVAGHIGACLVGQSNKPKICFGLTKEIDADPRFTFLVLFRTGKKGCKPTGSLGEIKSDGTATTIKDVYSLGEFKLPLTLETKRDPKTSKVTESKVVVGDIEVAGKESGVVIVDLAGEKPAYKFVKVDLPVCKVDLADKDHNTWAKVIDDAKGIEWSSHRSASQYHENMHSTPTTRLSRKGFTASRKACGWAGRSFSKTVLPCWSRTWVYMVLACRSMPA